MNTSYRYIIHCLKMNREEIFIASSHTELIESINRYVERYGLVDLLYNVGRV